MDDRQTHCQSLDFDALFAICRRLVSVETVNDAYALARKIRDAAKIFEGAALRIAGLDAPEPDAADSSRSLDAEQPQSIDDQIPVAVAEYTTLYGHGTTLPPIQATGSAGYSQEGD